MDKSNGYEAIAEIFVNGKGRAINGIGSSFVRRWARSLPPASVVLDLGCGTGVPVSRMLIDAGMTVCGIDAAPTLVKVFHDAMTDQPVKP
jgi:2-polyprenyl-3-methyl-5-hydroxy-6-metoxy-1,4-benzoquinol methylase